MLISKPPRRALFPILGALLFVYATLTSEPAHAFGKKPIQLPPPSTPTEPSDPGSVIRARWESKNRDGAAWSVHVFNTIPKLAPNLLSKAPADIAQFCPAYNSLSTADKKNFWVYLMSSMSEFESGQDPSVKYTEAFPDVHGNRVVSRGLLQISIESGNAYGCGFANENEIHDPIKNLDCGLRIMNKWIGKDGRIQGFALTWLGAARYWSVLRAPKVAKIEAYTNALRMCGN